MTAEAWDRASLWRFRAKPIRVIDGDSLIVLCDCGFYGRHEARIRIADLWAPERNEPGGSEATARLAAALAADAAEWPLRIVSRQRETVVSEVRSFERYVADVYVVQPDGSLKDVRELVLDETMEPWSAAIVRRERG